MKNPTLSLLTFIICCLMITTIVCLLLTGCTNAEKTGCTDITITTPMEVSSQDIQNDNIYVITDPETGVQYIVYREKVAYAGMGGITPRLNPDGSLCVVDVDKESDANNETD